MGLGQALVIHLPAIPVAGAGGVIIVNIIPASDIVPLLYGLGAPTIHPMSSCSSAWGGCSSHLLSLLSIVPVIPLLFASDTNVTSQALETLIFGHLRSSYHLNFSDILVTYVLHTSFISSLIIMIPHMSYDLILSS